MVRRKLPDSGTWSLRRAPLRSLPGRSRQPSTVFLTRGIRFSVVVTLTAAVASPATLSRAAVSTLTASVTAEAMLAAEAETPPELETALQTEDAADAEAPRATLTADQLKGLLGVYAGVTALSVEFRVDTKMKKPSGNGMPYFVYRRLVAKAPCYLFYDASHGSETLDWRDDPLRQIAYYDESRQVGVYVLNRGFFQRAWPADAPLDGSLKRELFFASTGIWPLSGRRPPRPNGGPHVLLEVAKSPEHDQVRAKLERVGGAWCHVLFREAKDYLWLDTARSIRLMQREVYNQKTGALMSRYRLTDHVEIAPGIWCPMRIRNEQFDYQAPTAAGRRRKVIDAQVVVTAASSRIEDESVLEFQPRPGWVRLQEDDVKAVPVQVLPGGEDHLEAMSAWVKRYRLRTEPKPSPAGHCLAAICATVACIAASEMLLWRKRSSRKPRSDGETLQ